MHAKHNKRKPWLVVILVALLVALLIMAIMFLIALRDARNRMNARALSAMYEAAEETPYQASVVGETPVEYEVVSAVPAESEESESNMTLLDNEYIAVYLRRYSKQSMTVEYENKTDEQITVFLDGYAVNGLTFFEYRMDDILPKSKSISTYDFEESSLEYCDVDRVETISLYLMVGNDLDDEPLFIGYASGNITGEKTQQYNTDGYSVYSSGEYEILVRSSDLDDVDNSFVVCMENKTENPVLLHCESMAMNGLMVGGYTSSWCVHAHSRAYIPVSVWFYDDIDDYLDSIEHVDELKIQFGFAPEINGEFDNDGYLTDIVTIA